MSFNKNRNVTSQHLVECGAVHAKWQRRRSGGRRSLEVEYLEGRCVPALTMTGFMCQLLASATSWLGRMETCGLSRSRRIPG
jgi:hypothetical protein